MIPDEAVEAAQEQLDAMGVYVSLKYMRAALEAAAPHLIADPDQPDRADLSGIISGAVGGWNPATRAITDVTDAIFAAGYRKTAHGDD